ncbi:MAG: NAD(P)-dependent oxidoreductase [Patescibacteria group bacterium]
MKIAFFEVEGWEEKIVRGTLAGQDVVFSAGKISDAGTETQDAEIISPFIDSPINKETLARFPNLKFIATRSTGFDHIDLHACKERGILVSNVPGYGNNTVAEFAFGLILSLTRKIYKAIDRIKEAENFSLDGLRGIDLKGRTIGIIGTGRIGKEAIKIAKGFGMNVVAYDLQPNETSANVLGFSYAPLEELLEQSDVISIHAPLNESTLHLINSKNIIFIKRGAYLVNTARGGIVETGALLTALRDGILAGAGLDVLEEEGDIKDEMKFLSKGSADAEKLQVMLQSHALMNMENVLITPHNAFNSQEALERILTATLENVSAFVGGKSQNLVP